MNAQEILQLSLLATVHLGKPIQEIDEDIPSPLEEDGLDALGLYHYNANQSYIGIDTKKCCLVGLAENLNPCDVVQVVRIHELSHYVTHKGEAAYRGLTWKDFENDTTRPSMEKERMAQGFTYLWLHKFNPALLPAFEKLSSKSPLQYRQWEMDSIGGKPNKHALKGMCLKDAWTRMLIDFYQTTGRASLDLLARLLQAGLSREDISGIGDI